MDFSTIQLTEDGTVATLTLHRPGDGNAISVKMVEELEKAFNRIEDESKARVLVIRGGGDTFCAGIDLRDFPADERPNVYGFSRWEKVCRALERLPRPTIAAIDGEAAGGGFQLALACDVRVVSNRSTLYLNEVNMGFLPGMGTFRLAKYIGLGRARRLALTGRTVDATEAHTLGLADFVCEPGAFEQTLESAVEEFANADPLAVELTRRLLDEAFEMAYEDFLGGFLAAQHRASGSETFRAHVKKAHETNTSQGK